jgi:monooxygenase
VTDPEHVDVLIIGAGLSGVGAAAQLTREHPGKSYLVLERRAASGGTWDLFRYPGIRSDSDMYTLGYRFKPWRADTALADGPSILDYVRETAREYDVESHIRYSHRVTRADWDSATARWSVEVETPEGPRRITTAFLWSCSGYYDYDEGYTPELPGVERYQGQLVHPQQWPEDLDYRGKRVVVIGSGATAVTLVPAMAESGVGHVTMLQRSPTYILSLPAVDGVARLLRRLLPERAAYVVTRWKNVGIATLVYQLSQRHPRFMRGVIRKQNSKLLPVGYDVDTHFNPRYDPWDQRLCLVPDGNLFRALQQGTAEIVTDTVDTFTETGLRLASGRELEADIVVTATGLNLMLFGGIELTVDGVKPDLREQIAYKALMLSGLPNFAFTIGYTNASWTLKADLVAEYVCRLLAHLDEHGHRSVVPVPGPEVQERPFLDFTPGYVLRSLDTLPKQGHREPWRLRQNYLHDVRTIRRGDIDDGALRFG